MIKELLRSVLIFVFLILLQVLVLNNIQFSGYINPYMYILILFMLPFETPGWLGLVIGFILGFSIDLFSGTIGMHASATVFIAFIRPFLLRLIAPRDGYETGTFPRLYSQGYRWFFRYTIPLVFIHHFFLFYVEMFTFTNFFTTFLRVILSSIFSLGLILLSQFFLYKK